MDTETEQPQPEWIKDAVSAATFGEDETETIQEAEEFLSQVGIDCYVFKRFPEREDQNVVFQILVQPGQHLAALAILDRDLFNPREDMEALFAPLTDQELLDIDESVIVTGMKDRMERMVRAYEDELLKRGLAELESD